MNIHLFFYLIRAGSGKKTGGLDIKNKSLYSQAKTKIYEEERIRC
jgi:hypothetical protein